MLCRLPDRLGRLFGALALLVIPLTLLPLGQAFSGSDLEELQSGQIYRTCEAYYLRVDSYKADGRHYLIRDTSSAFIEETKLLKPRTKSEAFLLMECLNLAQGNGQFAFDEIIRIEAEDDDIIEMALTDATNNSNAAQFEANAELDAKYDLSSEMELAKEGYESRVREARAFALQQLTQSFGSITYRSDFSYGGGYNGGLFGFFQVAQLAALAVQSLSSPGMAGASNSQPIQTGNSSVTLAPPGGSPTGSNTGGSWAPVPPAGTGTATGGTAAPTSPAPSGSTALNTSAAVDPNAEATAGEESAALVSPTAGGTSLAGLPNAPKLDANCADYRITREDIGFAEVTNACQVPISFFWCWVERGRDSCEPVYLSNIVEPNRTVEIAGPSESQTQVAQFVVCDMINPDHICER